MIFRLTGRCVSVIPYRLSSISRNQSLVDLGSPSSPRQSQVALGDPIAKIAFQRWHGTYYSKQIVSFHALVSVRNVGSVRPSFTAGNLQARTLPRQCARLPRLYIDFDCFVLASARGSTSIMPISMVFEHCGHTCWHKKWAYYVGQNSASMNCSHFGSAHNRPVNIRALHVRVCHDFRRPHER